MNPTHLLCPAPEFDRDGDLLRFSVRVGERLVGAIIDRRTLHYSFPPGGPDDDPLKTYLSFSTDLDSAVRRRVAGGAADPVRLREHDLRAFRRSGCGAPPPMPPLSPGRPSSAVDPLFLAAPRVTTFLGSRALTQASGFFFMRDERLYLVTSRHVLIDKEADHLPDRLEIELHLNDTDLTRSTGFSMLLYRDGRAAWHQGRDSGGGVDVAALELEREHLPAGTLIHAFTPAHLVQAADAVPVGASLRVVGFPLGLHDALHHLPVLRHAMLASPYGIRFQGQGFFLTDGRAHRGTSGAAVLMPDASADAMSELPWKLLGVHSSRMDMGDRDLVLDETLGLNCVWYADILMTLTNA